MTALNCRSAPRSAGQPKKRDIRKLLHTVQSRLVRRSVVLRSQARHSLGSGLAEDGEQINAGGRSPFRTMTSRRRASTYTWMHKCQSFDARIVTYSSQPSYGILEGVAGVERNVSQLRLPTSESDNICSASRSASAQDAGEQFANIPLP
jgi:hypothetical protein